jgi:hypothetical protein
MSFMFCLYRARPGGEHQINRRRGRDVARDEMAGQLPRRDKRIICFSPVTPGKDAAAQGLHTQRSQEVIMPTQKPQRGRTSITGKTKGHHPDIANKGAFKLDKRTGVNRPVGNGGGKNRGDRRDMSPTYTGSTRHAARGNTPRVDVSTRKR